MQLAVVNTFSGIKRLERAGGETAERVGGNAVAAGGIDLPDTPTLASLIPSQSYRIGRIWIHSNGPAIFRTARCLPRRYCVLCSGST